MITPNKQQFEAIVKICDWYKTQTKQKQIFVLSGYAGTGKTTLINHIINDIFKLNKNEVAFATPTGKAASVLIQKGANATTIHRLIYCPVIKERDTEINGKCFHTKKVEFVKRKDIGSYKLIVLDEISMVGKKIMEDLLSYGVPILACGDKAQLPAILTDSHDLLQKPDYMLTEVVRQSKDNAIIDIATKVRLGQPILDGNYNNQVYVINRHDLTNNEFINFLLEADQVICGKNNTRIKLNEIIRKNKNIKSTLPIDGEKIICDLNNYDCDFDDRYSLVNGMSGTVSNFKILDEKLKLATISFKPDFCKETKNNMLIEYDIFNNNEYKYEKHQEVYLMGDGSYCLATPMYKLSNKNPEHKNLIRKEFLVKKMAIGTFMINQFQYGYAISCHKAQGSQWDYVVVIDEHKAFSNDGDKWLYTAITRAAKKLVIIR